MAQKQAKIGRENRLIGAFDAIKKQVPIMEVAQHYGLSVNRAGFALCPLHGERSPSLKIYPRTNTFHCFGCGAGTSVIDFVSSVQGIPALEAAKTLDAMYSLHLFDDKPLTAQERSVIAEATRKRSEDKALVESFNAWWGEAWRLVIWYHWHLKDERERLKPFSTDEEISAEFAYVLHETEKIRYMLDCLAETDERKKIDFYAKWRGSVKQIELYGSGREATKSA